MRSGCLNLLVLLFTASLATTLVVLGLFLLFSFAALSYESPARVEAILTLLAALVAIYLFVRVGVSIWRDLRGYGPSVGSGSAENPQSAEDRER